MWPEKSRRALLDACSIAGLNCLRLMSESLAVAVTYGLLRKLPTEVIRVMFIDVGAAHTNCAVVAFKENKLKVLGVASDHQFGGRTFEQLLFNHFHAQILREHKMDIKTNQKSVIKLRKECLKVKHTLSANQVVNWGVEFIMNDRDVRGTIRREEFEQMAAPHVPTVSNLMNLALQRANTQMADLHSCELIGGGSRVPIVQKVITDLFGRPLSKTCDSDEAVAKGCALQCAMLSPLMRVRDFDVVDCQQYDIVADFGPVDATDLVRREDPLFRASSPSPHFTIVTFEDVKAPFQVITNYENDTVLGFNRFVFSGFPVTFQDPNPIVKVKFQLGPHGLVSVTRATLMQVEPPEEKAPAEGEPMDTTPDADAASPEATESMDTTPDDASAKSPDQEAKKEGKVKKKYHRTELTVVHEHSGLDEKVRNLYSEKEATMANNDRVVMETSEARDTLERYVLEMRGRCEDSYDLGPYVQDSEKQPFFDMLMAEDDWLNSDEGFESNKSTYKSKFDACNAVGGKFLKRKYEHQQRPEAVQHVKKMVTFYRTWADNVTDLKFAHILEDKRQTVRTKCDEIDNFIVTELARQDRTPLNQDPVLTKAILIAKAKELDAVCKPIYNTPIPKPPEEKKTDETKATEEKAADGGATGDDAADGAAAEGATEPEPMDQAD
jgi:heat shock protein 4